MSFHVICEKLAVVFCYTKRLKLISLNLTIIVYNVNISFLSFFGNILFGALAWHVEISRW